MEQLNQIDKEIFLFFNGMHTGWVDVFMWWMSDSAIWIPLYLFLFAMILRKRTREWPKLNWQVVLLIILSISLAILLADQVSSGFLKPFIARLRPSHNPNLEGLVHFLPDENGNLYKGGLYGFVSSHAANSFAVAIFAAGLLKNKWAWCGMLVWASVVAYSRIYLGVHYPGDIIGGAIIGVLAGLISLKFYRYFERRIYSRRNP